MSESNKKLSKCHRCGRRHEPFEKKTEIIGHYGDAPIIKAYPEQGTGFLTFWCDYCKKEHLHGRGNGHRVAHCVSSSSPFEKEGYFLNDTMVLGQRLPPIEDSKKKKEYSYESRRG